MIAAMKKAYIACLASDRQALIDALFSLEKIMLIPLSEAHDHSEASERFLSNEKLLADAKPYLKKKGLLDGAPEFSEEDFENIDPSSVALSSEFREKLDLLAKINDSLEKEKRSLDELSPWLAMTSAAEDIRDSEFTSVITGTIPSGAKEKLNEALTDARIGFYGDRGKDGKEICVVIVCEREKSEETLAAAASVGFERCSLPIKRGKIYDEYNRVGEQYALHLEEKEKLLDKIRALADRSDELCLLSDQYRAELEKQSAPALSTDETVYIEGWICADDENTVREAVLSCVPDAAIEFADPTEEDEVPTAAKNNKIVSQFEAITNMFSVPSSREIDPNPIMAPWYWIIFGMMMGDVGYGAVMILGGLLFKKILKPKGNTRKLANIITLSGITTMIFGFVFNSFFCASIPGLPSYSIIDIENPQNSHILQWLIISAGIGFLHIFTALITNMYTSIKAHDPMSAIADNLSWILIFSGVAVAIVGMIKVEALKIPGIAAALLGAALILIFGGRKKKGFGKVTGGLVSLYGITGFISDALSYTRIIALAVSTGIIGFVMNTLAGKVLAIPIAGYVFAGLICIVGHAFNIVMGLLSAYVHDSRLQFIEFFGHFFQGGGKLFAPFKRENKSVEIIAKKEAK